MERLQCPLFLEFALAAKASLAESRGPKGDSDMKVEDVEGLLEGPSLTVSIPEGDTAFEMSEAIEKKVFPRVYKARHGKSDATWPEEAVAARSPALPLVPVARREGNRLLRFDAAFCDERALVAVLDSEGALETAVPPKGDAPRA